jgi:hypothetical protein
MRIGHLVFGPGAVLAALAAWSGCSAGRNAASPAAELQSTFAVDKANLVSAGTNPYWILVPGHKLHLKHGNETVTVTVLAQTRLVDGVETRVIEEREEQAGALVEVSRNYFAIDKATRDVYYFGEDVDIYKNGKLVGHEGAWLSGAGGAKFGLVMPGQVRVGARYCQELAPGTAMDRSEVVSVTETVTVPAGRFANCLHVKETTPLEGGTNHKWYAPGVGLIKDDDLELVKVEPAKP